MSPHKSCLLWHLGMVAFGRFAGIPAKIKLACRLIDKQRIGDFPVFLCCLILKTHSHHGQKPHPLPLCLCSFKAKIPTFLSFSFLSFFSSSLPFHFIYSSLSPNCSESLSLVIWIIPPPPTVELDREFVTFSLLT